MAQTVKHLPTMWETRVRSLGREIPLEKEMANHSSILAWKIPWMEEDGRKTQEGGDKCILMASLMDREAWRAAIHGVARVGHD